MVPVRLRLHRREVASSRCDDTTHHRRSAYCHHHGPPYRRQGPPDAVVLRSPLRRWAFNTTRRDDPTCLPDTRRVLTWASTHTHDVSALADTDVLRSILDSFTYRLDG